LWLLLLLLLCRLFLGAQVMVFDDAFDVCIYVIVMVMMMLFSYDENDDNEGGGNCAAQQPPALRSFNNVTSGVWTSFAQRLQISPSQASGRNSHVELLCDMYCAVPASTLAAC
jgi:hypothetical protein